MTIPPARKGGGKKLKGDGAVDVIRDGARKAVEAYKNRGVEEHIFLGEDRYLVYTKRIATVQSAS